jgi:pimeloyl-ACP methyl ester carboxylesterase
MTAPILLLHGLWSRGPEERLLCHRLCRYTGRRVERFGYHSMRRDFDDNVRALVGRLGRLDAEFVDLIGHSLGGLVVLAALRVAPDDRVRRAVLLGPPVRGSVSARRLARFGPLGHAILGRCGETLMAGAGGTASGAAAQIGIIAGDRPIGMGRLLGPMSGPGDGTVLVEETRLPGAAAHLVLPVSHTGLLFSDDVARAASRFLNTGRFDASARPR